METIKVLLKDQIPVSTDKAVTVEAVELSDGTVSEQNGEVVWELEVEPKKAVERNLSYSITWPKDKRISESRRFV